MFLNQQAFLFLNSTVQPHRRTVGIKALPSSAWRGRLSPTVTRQAMDTPAMAQSRAAKAGSRGSSRRAGFSAPSTLLSTQPLADRLSCGLTCHVRRPRGGEEPITCEHHSDVVPLSFLLSGHCIHAQQSHSHIFF